MKQFLLIALVLLAVISCTSLEKYEPDDLDIVLKGINFKAMWEKVKNNVNLAKNWLKSIGLYDPLVNLIKSVGSYYANNYCTSKSIPSSVCSSIVDFLLNLIK